MEGYGNYGTKMNCRTFFSCIKSIFGEYVTDIKFKNMIKEIMVK